MDTEKRFIAAPAEVRASAGRSLVGYASVFNSPANIGPHDEVVRPGAFRRSIADGHDIQGLVSHSSGLLLGRTANNSLRLSEDSKGLAFELRDLPQTGYANDLLELVKSGLVAGASFAFTLPRDGSGEIRQGRSRTLTDVDLWEISIVANPAYSTTSVTARSQPETNHAALLRRIRIATL